jgi:hypothetical protein
VFRLPLTSGRSFAPMTSGLSTGIARDRAPDRGSNVGAARRVAAPFARASGWMACAALSVLLACSHPTGPSARLGELFVLAPGERASLQGTAFAVRFVGVSGDSRCPVDVVCIQGGDAIVAIEVLVSGGGSTAYELHTGLVRPVIHDGIAISLVDLSPYPFSTRTIDSGEYRATLKAVRADLVKT